MGVPDLLLGEAYDYVVNFLIFIEDDEKDLSIVEDCNEHGLFEINSETMYLDTGRTIDSSNHEDTFSPCIITPSFERKYSIVGEKCKVVRNSGETVLKSTEVNELSSFVQDSGNIDLSFFCEEQLGSHPESIVWLECTRPDEKLVADEHKNLISETVGNTNLSNEENDNLEISVDFKPPSPLVFTELYTEAAVETTSQSTNSHKTPVLSSSLEFHPPSPLVFTESVSELEHRASECCNLSIVQDKILHKYSMSDSGNSQNFNNTKMGEKETGADLY